jgi:hypothetical protein
MKWPTHAAPRRFGGGEQLRLSGDLLLAALLTRLLRLKHEAAAPAEVDAAPRCSAIGLCGPDQAFEDIVVLLGAGRGGLRRIDADGSAEFAQQQRVVRPFLAALAALPAGDE